MCSIPGFDYRVDLVWRWSFKDGSLCCNMDGGNRVLVIICIWEGWRGGRKDVDEANFVYFFTSSDVFGPTGNILYPPNHHIHCG